MPLEKESERSHQMAGHVLCHLKIMFTYIHALRGRVEYNTNNVRGSTWLMRVLFLGGTTLDAEIC